MDGMPHGSTPGNPAEALAIKMAEDGGLETLKRIENKIAVLDSDTGAIKEALDALYGKYKKVLILRYQHNYSWAKISVQMRVPDSTVRNWHDRALDRLGEALSGMKKTSGILDRASRARV